MRAEDQEKILSELERRIAPEPAREALEESLYWERRRLRDDRKSPAYQEDVDFWDKVEKGLRTASEQDQKTLVRKAVRHYGDEIAGNFDERVYAAVTRVLPPALGLLLNAVSPMRVVKRLPDLPQLDDAVMIQGE